MNTDNINRAKVYWKYKDCFKVYNLDDGIKYQVFFQVHGIELLSDSLGFNNQLANVNLNDLIEKVNKLLSEHMAGVQTYIDDKEGIFHRKLQQKILNELVNFLSKKNYDYWVRTLKNKNWDEIRGGLYLQGKALGTGAINFLIPAAVKLTGFIQFCLNLFIQFNDMQNKLTLEQLRQENSIIPRIAEMSADVIGIGTGSFIFYVLNVAFTPGSAVASLGSVGVPLLTAVISAGLFNYRYESEKEKLNYFGKIMDYIPPMGLIEYYSNSISYIFLFVSVLGAAISMTYVVNVYHESRKKLYLLLNLGESKYRRKDLLDKFYMDGIGHYVTVEYEDFVIQHANKFFDEYINFDYEKLVYDDDDIVVLMGKMIGYLVKNVYGDDEKNKYRVIYLKYIFPLELIGSNDRVNEKLKQVLKVCMIEYVRILWRKVFVNVKYTGKILSWLLDDNPKKMEIHTLSYEHLMQIKECLLNLHNKAPDDIPFNISEFTLKEYDHLFDLIEYFKNASNLLSENEWLQFAKSIQPFYFRLKLDDDEKRKRVMDNLKSMAKNKSSEYWALYDRLVQNSIFTAAAWLLYKYFTSGEEKEPQHDSYEGETICDDYDLSEANEMIQDYFSQYTQKEQNTLESYVYDNLKHFIGYDHDGNVKVDFQHVVVTYYKGNIYYNFTSGISNEFNENDIGYPLDTTLLLNNNFEDGIQNIEVMNMGRLLSQVERLIFTSQVFDDLYTGPYSAFSFNMKTDYDNDIVEISTYDDHVIHFPDVKNNSLSFERINKTLDMNVALYVELTRQENWYLDQIATHSPTVATIGGFGMLFIPGSGITRPIVGAAVNAVGYTGGVSSYVTWNWLDQRYPRLASDKKNQNLTMINQFFKKSSSDVELKMKFNPKRYDIEMNWVNNNRTMTTYLKTIAHMYYGKSDNRTLELVRLAQISLNNYPLQKILIDPHAIRANLLYSLPENPRELKQLHKQRIPYSSREELTNDIQFDIDYSAIDRFMIEDPGYIKYRNTTEFYNPNKTLRDEFQNEVNYDNLYSSIKLGAGVLVVGQLLYHVRMRYNYASKKKSYKKIINPVEFEFNNEEKILNACYSLSGQNSWVWQLICYRNDGLSNDEISEFSKYMKTNVTNMIILYALAVSDTYNVDLSERIQNLDYNNINAVRELYNIAKENENNSPLFLEDPVPPFPVETITTEVYKKYNAKVMHPWNFEKDLKYFFKQIPLLGRTMTEVIYGKTRTVKNRDIEQVLTTSALNFLPDDYNA